MTAPSVAGTWQAAPPRKGTSTLVQASARPCVARSCSDQRPCPSAPAFTQPSRCQSWMWFTDGEMKGQAWGSGRMRKGTALCLLDCVSCMWNDSPVGVMLPVLICQMGNQSLERPCGLCEAPWSSAFSACALPPSSPAGCGPPAGPFVFLCPWFSHLQNGANICYQTASRDCCCSVAESYLILCHPCGLQQGRLPVLHHLPELAQIPVH